MVLDEIGRGTATYDGLAIAWATAEALHDVNRARTLFATHYHELAQLETRLDHVCNLSMVAREWNGELVFLHEAAPGAARGRPHPGRDTRASPARRRRSPGGARPRRRGQNDPSKPR